MKIERPFPHEDTDRFRSCIAFTAREREFSPLLVEKDYFCSLILSAFAETGNDLVFKGGTCLGKVFLDFFRLSEDLDFAVSVPGIATRSYRRKVIRPYKQAVGALAGQLPGIAVKESLTGRNESTQYVATIEYESLTVPGKGSVKIDNVLLEMVRKKLAFPGNEPVNISAERLAELQKQVERQLRPVLRTRDFEQFDLDRIWTALVTLVARLKEI